MRPELAAEAFLQIALGRTRARDPVERRPHVKLVAEQGGVVGAEAHVDHVLIHILAGREHLGDEIQILKLAAMSQRLEVV